MKKNNIFSPFYYHFEMEEHSIIKDAYIDDIMKNFNSFPDNSKDWKNHSSYTEVNILPKELDWWTSVQYYKKYVNQFINHYFRGLELDWRIDAEPWYNVYGKGQKADWHDHMPSDFSAVHFLKYNPEVHQPFMFTNPDLTSVRLQGTYKPNIVDRLGTCAKQSYYKGNYIPEIEEGDFIIFPSQMMHLVNASESEDLRVTIAFNFNILNE